MALPDKFDISSISKKLNNINIKNSNTNYKPFPCLILLSNYQFQKRAVNILPNGDIKGGFTKMIISLIDFSFVRSFCSSCYSIKSPPTYDPVSLFLLELFRYIDRYQNMDKFLEVLRDKDRDRAYRTYAGIISMDNIPTKGTFSNFKARLGCRLYNKIFHIFVGVFYKLEMITFNIIAHDGTLFPTRARYKGCTWFSDKCSRISAYNVVARVKKQILYRLNNLNKINFDKAFMIKCECPYVPEGKKYKKNPKFEVLCLKLGHIDEKPTIEQNQTAMLFNVVEELDRPNLFSKHTYIKDNPRLINEIPRGSWRFKKLTQFRSASERVNSVIKEDLKIIDKPIVYNKQRADILAQIAAIILPFLMANLRLKAFLLPTDDFFFFFSLFFDQRIIFLLIFW